MVARHMRFAGLVDSSSVSATRTLATATRIGAIVGLATGCRGVVAHLGCRLPIGTRSSSPAVYGLAKARHSTRTLRSGERGPLTNIRTSLRADAEEIDFDNLDSSTHLGQVI